MSMVRAVDTHLCAIMTTSITSTMVICITRMAIMSTNMLSRSTIPIPHTARPTLGALTRMARAADTNPCLTVITSTTSWTEGCITHMTAIATITGLWNWCDVHKSPATWAAMPRSWQRSTRLNQADAGTKGEQSLQNRQMKIR